MELYELEQFCSNMTGRITEIQRKIDNIPGTLPIEFRGQSEKLPVIRVRIGFPVYRLNNGRTSTYQLEYLALHPDLPEDFFKRDNDAISAQKAQHEVLERLIAEENLLKSFKEEEKQIEPLICTNTGVVVNGNRRLCAWRKLYISNPDKYKHFETIEIAILPECDDKEIQVLEEKLQIRKEKRAEYKWHAKAMMAQLSEKNGTKHADVAKAFAMSSQSLTLLLNSLKYADKYLKSIGKPDQWSLVDKEYHAFDKLVKNIKKFEIQGDQELFETLVFNMISQGSSSGRLYEVIDDLADNFEKVKAKLATKYSVSSETESSDSAIDILAGEHVERDVGSKIAGTICSSDEKEKIKAISYVNSVVSSEKEIRREQEAATYLINQVSKASSLLKAAADQGLREDSEIEGVQDHLDTIKKAVSDIEKWLSRK